MADVLSAIDAAPNLSAVRRRDLASATRTVARLLGAHPAGVPAEPRLLARRMGELVPAALGLSAQRWANIRSMLRASVELVGPIAPGRHLAPFTPAWGALWDRTDDRGLKIALSRIMRFAGEEGLEPADVDASLFDRFRAHLDRSLIRLPESAFLTARSAWERARRKVPGWPDVAWPKGPRRPLHFSLPWDAFAESLRRDVDAWAARLRGNDLFESTHRPLRPSSVANRVQRLRGFASALVHRGRDPASLTSLRSLVEVDTVKEGLRFYLERNGNRPARGVADIGEILLAIAQHHLDVPQNHLVELRSLVARLRPPRQHGMTERNRARLRALDDPENLRALIHLPQRLMADAGARPLGKRAAVLAQTALAIELLLVAPVRISNLASIDLERHLTRPGRNRGVVVLSFAREEVKNATPLDYPLPQGTIALLNTYMEKYRPLLAAIGSTALFPALGGGAKSRAVLGTRISRTVFEQTGLRVHPHLFRHIAAKLQLEAEPGSYELVRRVLGHASIETTTRAYAGTETAAAVRHYDRTLERLRAQAPPDILPRRRRPVPP